MNNFSNLRWSSDTSGSSNFFSETSENNLFLVFGFCGSSPVYCFGLNPNVSSWTGLGTLLGVNLTFLALFGVLLLVARMSLLFLEYFLLGFNSSNALVYCAILSIDIF